MKNLSPYQIHSTLYEGSETIIYRGQIPTHPESTILKVLKAEYPTLEAITRLKHEYQIRQTLDHPNIVPALSLETFNHRLALLLEDFGGNSLSQLLQTEKLPLINCLSIATQLTKALEYLHQNQIIHKDIKPSNIIINPQTGLVKLTDFGIASRLSKENPLFHSPNFVEGTLLYMSPEQTGRMNRTLDYRTDFYSLGVTLYEMLVGQLPFASHDPLEIVYSHIAQSPIPPQQLNPEIPPAISELVMKLMAKNAEDRYQSAAGLLADLEICLDLLTTTGRIGNFIPGQLDIWSQLLIPQKLYGREEQVNLLLAAFERIGGGSPDNLSTEATPNLPVAGRCELMLVSGYSGIGKSAVVNEVNKPITRQRGYFISGKFDQFKRNIPYASLTQAFSSLMRQLLTEKSEKLQEWREKILTAVGANGQVIIDVIPDVELIIGQQPEVPQLGPTESQNRFNRVFQEFIRVFTQKEHPLVIFLDDLQWTDSATLKLMQLLVTDPDSQYLLVIGAYRDNEVSPTHPLMQILEEIEQTDTAINRIVLQPLSLADVTQLIADTLNERTTRINPLAELICNKTGGNPFFFTQLLQALAQENLLKFDFKTVSWQWSLAEIQAIGITDKSVVELVAGRIAKLPQATINILKLAACVGDRFTLDVLSIVNEQSPSAAAAQLYPALQMGLVLPLSEAYKIPLVFNEEVEKDEFISSKIQNLNSKLGQVSYKFLHDRVQQAAYSLIPESQKQQTHLQIGQLLLQSISESEVEENIFEIVNQLNMSIELIADLSEKVKLAKLNLIAGKKAKAATAYEPALRYLTLGLELLPADSWQSQYSLTLDLHVAAIEAEYLNAHLERAETLANVALEQATTLLDRVSVYKQKIQLYIGQNQMLSAIATGRQVLELLGVSLSNLPSSGGEPIVLPTLEDLETIPVLTDPYQLAAMEILMAIAPAGYQADTPTYLQALATLVNLSIVHGYSGISAFGFAHYGVILCAVMGDIDAGYHADRIAWLLFDKFRASELKSKIYLGSGGYVRLWREHLRETIPIALEGIQSGLDVGNLEFASYNAHRYCDHLFFAAEPLDVTGAKMVNYIDMLQRFKQEGNTNYIQIWHQLVLNLQGLAPDRNRLIGQSFDETTQLPQLLAANNQMVICCLYLAKTMLAYLFKDVDQALENTRAAERYKQAVLGSIIAAEHNFYSSLTLLQTCAHLWARKRQKLLSQVEGNQEILKHWACHAPMNYQHKYDLIAAERARIRKQNWEAMEYYDRAIAGAREQGYVQEEALGNELAAEFYLGCGREKIGRTYLTDAYYGYIRWGAIAKVKDLETQYPFLVEQTPNPKTQQLDATRTTTGSTTSGSFSTSLDVGTFIKFSQAITSEIVLESLLSKLVKLLLENAAAQKGVLLLKDECKDFAAGRLCIEATGTVTDNTITVLQSIPVETRPDLLPLSVVHYVFRSQENLVLNDATVAEPFNSDPYIQQAQPRAILCLPILYQSQLQGIIYLENNLTVGAFTKERLEVLNAIVSQAAIAIINAQLYARVRESENRLRQFLDAMPVGVFVTNRNGQPYYTNGT
ncbi:MAG TPA: serine/threonine protein kinase [Cyanobacteria bacterium UBA8803]|nr:serine/threonine protein kinase [Cyanobacteria bacterium UBA9273]HBL57046.1 serine/threonine protein kinase [Cyanobacteria bacterium UBA8803]